MTPDELDAIEAEIVEGDESVDDLAALIVALREAWAQIERFDDVLWKKCEEKVDAERERDEQRGRAEKQSALLERLWGRASRAMRQRDEAEAAIARVRALHSLRSCPCGDVLHAPKRTSNGQVWCDGPDCRACGRDYPCPTIDALDGGES